MNSYQGEGTSRGERFQLNIITSLIWNFFFSNGDFVSGIFSGLFQDSFIFGEVTSSHFFNYFDTTVNLSEDLFLQSSYFFLRSSVFERVIPSQLLFFWNT